MAEPKITKRQKYDVLKAELENERASFMTHWRELGEYIYPRRPRFTASDVNKGDKRNQKIIDSTATMAARTLRSGMMGGVTSPARPWFRLSTPDPTMAEQGAVKEWLSVVTDRMSNIFLKSNLYNVLPIVYGDMGIFGTSAMMVEEDFEDVIRCYAFPIGSYSLAQNSKLKVDTFFRTFQMTIAQVVDKFAKQEDGSYDWSNISDHVKRSWEQGQRQQWIEVNHVITMNDEWRPGRETLSKYKKISSCYYESGMGGQTSAGAGYLGENDRDKYLSEKGYDYFPVLAPRWEINGSDVYGTSCPGMDALGDIKQLQTAEKRILQAIEKSIHPPIAADNSLKTQKTSILPGDTTYAAMRDGKPMMSPIHEIDPRIAEMEQKQEQTRQRIKRALFEDLFLMMAESDRREITAREIDERHEEKLLALGPVLEQLNQDALDELIDITFMIMDRQGKIPPPPEELQGIPLRVEYISVMAQAQKLVAIAGIERFAGFVGQIAQQTGDPSVLDKVDIDQLIDVYGDITSVPPGIVRSDEDVQAMKQQRAQAAAAQRAAETAPAAADTMKTLSQADTSGDNALTRLIQAGQAGNVVPTN